METLLASSGLWPQILSSKNSERERMRMYMHINQKEFVAGTGKLGGGRERTE